METYLERRKLDKQLKYANKRGFALVVVAGPDEVAAGTASVKDLRSGEQRVVPVAELPAVRRAGTARAGVKTPCIERRVERVQEVRFRSAS